MDKTYEIKQAMQDWTKRAERNYERLRKKGFMSALEASDRITEARALLSCADQLHSIVNAPGDGKEDK